MKIWTIYVRNILLRRRIKSGNGVIVLALYKDMVAGVNNMTEDRLQFFFLNNLKDRAHFYSISCRLFKTTEERKHSAKHTDGRAKEKQTQQE